MNKIVGKIDSFNRGKEINNVTIFDLNKNPFNIKLTNQQLETLTIGRAYQFVYETTKGEVRDTHFLVSANLIEEVLEKDELSLALKTLYQYAPIELKDLKNQINEFLLEIKNPNFKLIVDELYKEYEKQFFVHPAATKFHHTYVGGLAYHTLNMLKGAKGFLEVYPYLNKDLLYSGIFIHDLAKIDEISGVDGEYTNAGLLLGHLVIITNKLEKLAIENNLENSEEIMLLKHIGISHHGLPNFGSAKRPQTAEALLIWYLDTIDSKLETLGEELALINKGTFTANIPVLDKMRFYKPNLEEK